VEPLELRSSDTASCTLDLESSPSDRSGVGIESGRLVVFLRFACRPGRARLATMNTPEFDSLSAARELEGAGAGRQLSEAIAATVRDARNSLVTSDEFRAGLAELRADFYRALWIQTGVIFAGVGTLLTLFQFVA